MSSLPTKVLCIGMDAANPELLRRWASDGSLPNLRSLMDRGLTGDLDGIRGFYVGSTWPSFYSGVSPARHGFHYLVQLEAGSYMFYRPADQGISFCEPFWVRLGEAGHRVAVLDVPLTRLEPSLKGVQIVEWGGHDSVYGFQASPKELGDRIRSTFGLHPLGLSCDGVRRTPGDYEAFLTRLTQGVRAKSEITRQILGQGPWDFFIQVFTESHCVGHQCWHLHDPAHPAHDPSLSAAIGDPVHRVYQAIDEAIGEILEEARDALIFLFSAHSMEHAFGAHFLLRDILFRLGVAEPQQTLRSSQGEMSPLHVAVRGGWRLLPEGVRSRLTPIRDRMRNNGNSEDSMPSLEVDVASSLCFVVPNGLAVGGIRLNLKGRDPQGCLEPEAADAFCSHLTRDLMEILDERTGQPLIRRVVPTDTLYAGNHLNRLPDLLVEWDDTVPMGSTNLGVGAGASVRASSKKTGVLEGVNDYPRSGEHRPRGMFVAAGPNVPTGELGRPVSILDLAPTLAGRLGLALPECDGIPIPELALRSSAPEPPGNIP